MITVHRANAIGTEEMGPEGPTGHYRLVKRAELQDYGGNVYATATTARGMDRAKAPCGVPTRWVPVEIGGEVDPAEIEPRHMI